MKNIGTLTLGFGTSQERTIQLTDVLRCEFKDHRLCTIAKDEEGGYLLSVENPSSTGRHPECKMYLTEGSLAGLLFTIHTFMVQKNMDFEQLLKEYNLDEDAIRFESNLSE